MKKKETLFERIAVYGFVVVVLGGLLIAFTWFMGAGVLLILEVLKDILEPLGVPDLSRVDEVFGPILAGLPVVALIGTAMHLYDRRGYSTSDVDGQENSNEFDREISDFERDAVERHLGGQLGICPFCGNILGRKPTNPGVGFASEFFLECENNHESIIYSAVTKDWSTKNSSIADQLMERGMAVRKRGEIYFFGDAKT
ncbi:hypothetical protein N9M66_00325 [Litoreibacter sp.]|nr:hypothetical protein [Litoreibacter sp.]